MVIVDDSTGIEVKNLSEESQRLLNELEAIPMKYVTLARSVYDSLTHNDGLQPKEARVIIEQRIHLSYRTLMRALPEEAKGPQKPGKRTKEVAKVSTYSATQAKLADVEPVKIPAPEYEVIEHKSEPPAPEPVVEPEKPEPLPELPKEFHLDLRIIRSPAWTKAVGWATSNGEAYISLLPNKYGDLNLKL